MRQHQFISCNKAIIVSFFYFY